MLLHPLQNCIFSRAVALLFNWKYFWGWNLVQITCRWCADDVQMTQERDFRWDFTGGWYMSSARRLHGIATALHKAYWLPCFIFFMKKLCLWLIDLRSKARLEKFITQVLKNRSIVWLVTHCFILKSQSMSLKWKLIFYNRQKISTAFVFMTRNERCN